MGTAAVIAILFVVVAVAAAVVAAINYALRRHRLGDGDHDRSAPRRQ